MQEKQEPFVSIPLSLLEDFIMVCDSRASLSACYRAGETYETCPDQNTVDYLDAEAIIARVEGEEYLPEDSPLRPSNNAN